MVNEQPEHRPRTVARLVAEFLVGRGVERVYGLCGGHIQPLWDEVARAGVRVVDVRHECAAVYMAHADAALGQGLGAALVTAGPGVTNAVTGIANAFSARIPVLIVSGRTPRPQEGMGAMQGLPQTALVGPVCRRAESVSQRHRVLPSLHAAAEAALGADGPPGPAYV
nr:thiamine pyrophosphate-binding protein [Euzebyales bacterium]